MEIDRFKVHKTFPIFMKPVTFTFFMVLVKKINTEYFLKMLNN
jgi:hypothetical protein